MRMRVPAVPVSAEAMFAAFRNLRAVCVGAVFATAGMFGRRLLGIFATVSVAMAVFFGVERSVAIAAVSARLKILFASSAPAFHNQARAPNSAARIRHGAKPPVETEPEFLQLGDKPVFVRAQIQQRRQIHIAADTRHTIIIQCPHLQKL